MVLPVIAVPWIIGGLSAAAGALGLKKGVDAKKNFDRAKSIIEEAKDDFEKAQERIEKTKAKATKSLANLGKQRIQVEASEMKRFVDLVRQVNQATYTPITLGARQAQVSIPELREIESSSYQAADVLKDGLGALSTGALVGIGASGLASQIGVVAGSGALIGNLSGVAATNATLAWLGGGSLASGGLGMAGGTAILGGAIAGPALAVIGYAAASKSEKALTAAYEQEAEIRELIEQLENGNALLNAIRERSEELRTTIKELADRFGVVLSACELMIDSRQRSKAEAQVVWDSAGTLTMITRRLRGARFQDPLSFENFSAEEKIQYSMLNLLGVALYRIIKVKVLDDDGVVTAESDLAVAEARTLLRES